MYDGETSIQTRLSYHEAEETLHCALENGLDLHVNEHQKTWHYRARSNEEECQISFFYFARRASKLRCYSNVMHSFNWKSVVEHDGGVKMRG